LSVHCAAVELEIHMKNLIITLSVASSVALFATSTHAALDDTKAQDLMKRAGCAICHFVDKKLVGPSYKDVAIKTVRMGSKDAYGPIPMPPNPTAKISDAELHELAQWILTK
jgi:cytochrome c